MATTALNTGNLTLVDNLKRRDPNGAIAQVAEYLSRQSAVQKDAVWKEGNLPTGHRYTYRYALPSVAWRRYNEGVAPSKSRTGQVDEACAMLEAWSKVDCDLAELNGDVQAFRLSESLAFLESMAQEFESTLIYGSSATAPEEFSGLTYRANTISGNTYNSNYVISADASPSGSDQTSIHLVGWGDRSVYCVYPKGTTGGLQTVDHGRMPTTDSNGNYYDAFISRWTWKVGLCVEDHRYYARICNIDTSAISTTGTNIVTAMIKAYHRVEKSGAKFAWYCNRTIAEYLHHQSRNELKNSGEVKYSNVAGEEILTVMGYPVRVTDAILNTEAVVS